MARLYDQIGQFFSNQFGIKDPTDSTKIIRYSCSNLATSTTKTIDAALSPISEELKVCTATVTRASSTTLQNITGLTGFTLVASGVYSFEIDLQTNCSTNGGISIALKYTTATVSAMQLSAWTGATATFGQAATNTTTTDATLYIDNKTAAWLHCVLTGTLTVGTAGTVAVQMTQNTSHADTTTVYIGSWARFTRIS